MRKFDTNVQHLKYKVLREVARAAWDNTLLEVVNDIPNIIVAGKEATMRCCVYKERAIAARRVKMAMGGNRANHNVIEVINIACDECPVAGYEVTNSCRGCIAHYCKDVCKRNAIVFDRKTKAAYIDKEKCAECGMCEKVCPYSAIVNFKRPCEKTCKVKAITVETQGGDTPSGNRECKIACIDNEKCIACGACVYQCPFGAIMDKSFILDVIDIILKSENNTKYKVFAVAAPSIGSQFSYAKPGQVITGLKEIGFEQVAEAALGADMVAYKESQELYEKAEEIKYITSSCCPAFVDYIKKQFPELVPHISHNLSPMAEIAKHIKKKDPTAKIIFIGPCTAKKAEMKTAEVSKYIDSVITFEELQALFDSRNIDITKLPEENLNDASYFGRVFARSGGLAIAVAEGIKEHGYDFELRAVSCNGIEECKKTLLKLKANADVGNFIEGMACYGGCIGGAGCLTHGEKNRKDIDKYAEQSTNKKLQTEMPLP